MKQEQTRAETKYELGLHTFIPTEAQMFNSLPNDKFLNWSKLKG